MKNANKFCLAPIFMFILLCSIFLSSCAPSLPDYDFREEQFVGTEDYEAFLQTDEARAAFPTPDCESACKIVLLESTDFFRAVREGTLRLALQHPQRYLWMVGASSFHNPHAGGSGVPSRAASFPLPLSRFPLYRQLYRQQRKCKYKEKKRRNNPPLLFFAFSVPCYLSRILF